MKPPPLLTHQRPKAWLLVGCLTIAGVRFATAADGASAGRIVLEPEAGAMQVRAGETLEAEVRLRNHGPAEARALVAPVLPSGWSVEPPERRLRIAARQTGTARFRLIIPADRPLPMRTVLTANVTFNGTELGELPERLIDQRADKDTWAAPSRVDVRAILGYPKAK